jgi:hypothetical protein
MTVRKQGNKEAIGIADLWFYETVVRLHRKGEGTSYTRLKLAGLDRGPVLPKVEKAMEKGYIRMSLWSFFHVLLKNS